MDSYSFGALKQYMKPEHWEAYKKQHERLALDPDSPWCIAICPHCAAIGPKKDMDEHIEKWCEKQKERHQES